MRSSTTGGGSTGRRSADAECTVSSHIHPAGAQQHMDSLTLRSRTASTGTLRLLNHLQDVPQMLTSPGDSIEHDARVLIGRRSMGGRGGDWAAHF